MIGPPFRKFSIKKFEAKMPPACGVALAAGDVAGEVLPTGGGAGGPVSVTGTEAPGLAAVTEAPGLAAVADGMAAGLPEAGGGGTAGLMAGGLAGAFAGGEVVGT